MLKYEHLTAARVAELHHWCARRFYFRWQYLRQNAHLLWPVLRKFGLGRERRSADHVEPPTGPHRPAGADSLRKKASARTRPLNWIW